MSNNEAISENEQPMPVVQEMIRDIRAEANTAALADEERFIEQALALPVINEATAVSEEAASASADSTSDELNEAVNSTVKRLSMARNSAELLEVSEPEARFSRTISIQHLTNLPLSQLVPEEEPQSAPAAASSLPKRKPHIMISYSRTSSNTCRRIRKSLRALKYKVWMDVYDMRGNIVDGMANAIANSYIVLVCLSHRYELSKWCRREIEDVAERDIHFIPCFMEEPFTLASWLNLLLGRRLWIDFSEEEQYNHALTQLINEISAIEEQIAMCPRETPPITPGANGPTTISLNPPAGPSTDLIMRDFKTWVEENQASLRQLHPQQSSELIRALIRAARTDEQTPDDRLIQQLFSSNPQARNSLFQRLNGDFPLIQSLCLILALWTAGVLFRRT